MKIETLKIIYKQIKIVKKNLFLGSKWCLIENMQSLAKTRNYACAQNRTIKNYKIIIVQKNDYYKDIRTNLNI